MGGRTYPRGALQPTLPQTAREDEARFMSDSRQHFLYFLPLPHQQGSFLLMSAGGSSRRKNLLRKLMSQILIEVTEGPGEIRRNLPDS